MQIIELQYLPQPIYLALLLKYPNLEVDGYEYYVKQTYRNRCRILTANGIDELTIPVLGGSKKNIAKDIKIDHSQKWHNRNWRAIQSAYGKAPFFEYYAEDLLRVYDKKHKYLFDLSHELLTQCLEFLEFDIKLKFTSGYHNHKKEPQNDFRSVIRPKSNPSLLNTYDQVPYQQVFGNNFVNNLSVIDIIFCEGPQAGKIIKSGLVQGTE